MEYQNKAQSDDAHIGLVRARWDNIYKHLKLCEKRSIAGSWQQLWVKLEARKGRQLNELYTLAYWLMPTNVMQARMPVGELEQVLSTLKQHIAPDAYP